MEPEPEPGSPDPDDAGEFGSWEDVENTLAAAAARAELLSGFGPGGTWHGRPAGPELAAALAAAAGADFRCGMASGDERIGILRGMAALQSWAAAGMLGAVRALIRDDAMDFPDRARHGDLPDDWDDSLTHEIALALAVSAPSADKTMRAAWELGARLPGTALLLKDGILDLPRARLITEVFGGLSDADAAKAEELLLPELTGPTRKTWTQIERIAAAIAAAVDPDLAERQRKAAEKHLSRVMMFRERNGTAALSGRNLPSADTLAAHANLAARALEYKNSGAFPDESLDRLRATAYLDLLNGVAAEQRIASGQLGLDDIPDPGGPESRGPESRGPESRGPESRGPESRGPDDDGDDGGGGALGDGPDPDPGPDPNRGVGLGPADSDCPCRECDGSCAPPDNDFPDGDGDPDDDGPGETDDDNTDDDGPGDIDDDNTDDGGPDDGGPDEVESEEDGPTGDGPDLDDPSGHEPSDNSGGDDREPALTDLVLPLATLLGLAERPGEGHGLGPLDPALCRALAAIAIRSTRTTVCITVTDHDGIAIGHGCARPGRLARPPGGPPSVGPPSLVALPARINLTVTAARLAGLLARPSTQERSGAPPPGTRMPAGWAFSPRGTMPGSGSPGVRRAAGTAVARRSDRPPGDPAWCGGWTLTLPSGLEWAVTLEPVPTYDCDHRNESHAYKPNDTLRHLVQVRDYTCTFPSCNRHARQSDFEHAVPYDQGGRTCACNAGARSRKCHRVKQSPGWTVTQPRPGWHQWTTPRGWTYTQGPKRYPV
jgi:Domain of unknown function (DUF222)